MTLDYIYHSGFESYMIISCKGRVNYTYWPPISIPTTLTVRY